MAENGLQDSMKAGAVRAEVRLLLADAAVSGHCVDAVYEAGRLADAHPDAGLSADEIAEVIAHAAASAGVPVALGRHP